MEQKIRKRQSHNFIQRTFVVSKTTNRRFYEVNDKLIANKKSGNYFPDFFISCNINKLNNLS